MNIDEIKVAYRHFESESLENWFKKFEIIQFAIYMVILENKSVASNTLKNNQNSLKIIASLYKNAGTEVISRKDLHKCKDLVAQEGAKAGGMKKLNTLKGYLNHFNAVVHSVYCQPEFRARI
jgi:hypothetical protein